MEQRKIIKFGSSSYVVTLPYEWIQANNLERGDSVNVGVNQNMLYISLPKEKEQKRAVINFDNKPLKIFRRELISFYLKNHQFIEIKGKNILEHLNEVRQILEKLSSLEIVEIQDESVLLKDLTDSSTFNLDEIIDEMVKLGQAHFAELLKSKGNNKEYFLSNLDVNINKLSFLAYKGINCNLDRLANPSQAKSSIYYWRIVQSFEQIGDIVKRIGRYLKDVDETQLSYLNQTISEVKGYFEFVTSLLRNKDNLENNLKLNQDKKQSLLKEIEMLRDKFEENLNLYLVITQLLKDIIGSLEDVVVSVIDLNCYVQ